MDIASRTIDRHEPIIPDYIQGTLNLPQEHLMTKVKNQFILRYCNVGQIKRWVKQKPTPSTLPPKVITKELLERAWEAVEKCYGVLNPTEIEYLDARQITQRDIERFKICSTEALCTQLSPEDITNLSLRISDKFNDIVSDHNIVGISVPCFNGADFYGFGTRIINQPLIKYSVTIPHRFCFGVDWTRRDHLFVVEGIFDAIKMINAGYNCMALSDSQPNYWKMTIANQFQTVKLLFDNDYSGLVGACKAHVILHEMLGRDPNTIELLIPSGKDPAMDTTWLKTDLKTLAARLTIMGKDI